MITRLKASFPVLAFLLIARAAAFAGPAAAATQPGVIEVDEKTKVHLLGVSKYPPDGDSWFAFNGEPIDLPDQRAMGGQVHAQPAPEHQLAFRLEKPATTAVRLHIDGATVAANHITKDDTGEMILISAFGLEMPAKTAKVRLGFATSEWKTLAASDRPTEPLQADAGGDVGQILLQPVEAEDGGAKVVFEHAQVDDPHRYVVIDDKDKEHEAGKVSVQSDGQTVSTACTFDVAPEKVKRVLFQTRKFTKLVEISEISLEKGHATQPKVDVREVK
jgi:hypothetical protein